MRSDIADPDSGRFLSCGWPASLAAESIAARRMAADGSRGSKGRLCRWFHSGRARYDILGYLFERRSL